MKKLGLALILTLVLALPMPFAVGSNPTFRDDFNILDPSRWEWRNARAEDGWLVLERGELWSIEEFENPITLTFRADWSGEKRIKFGLVWEGKSYGMFFEQEMELYFIVAVRGGTHEKIEIAPRGKTTYSISWNGTLVSCLVDNRTVATFERVSDIRKVNIFAEAYRTSVLRIDYIEISAHSELIPEELNEEPRERIRTEPEIRNDTQVYQVAAIWVQFSDIKTKATPEELYEYFDIVKDYYYEVSYGKAYVNITLFGPYTLNQTMWYYGRDGRYERDDWDSDWRPNGRWLVEDSILRADKDINYLKYKHTMIVHAGDGQESDPSQSDLIWSMWFNLFEYQRRIITDEFTYIQTAWVVPESEIGGVPIGVYAHEFGHELGLPDQYHTLKWSLMGQSGFLGNPPGSSPSHFLTTEKQKLGWISGESIESIRTEDRTIRLYPQELGQGIIMLEVGDYRIEARRMIGFDSYIPQEGVLITFIYYHERITAIVDAHPETRGDLNDATLKVGEFWVNEYSSLRVRVLGEYEDGSYTVQIEFPVQVT